MEEIINKPDSQFKDILNDLIDYSKDSEEKSALIKEVCLARRPNKPAASLNSSIYSSTASSSSSTSSASDSSTNSASSSSTSSTLSSPSQSSQGDGGANNSGGCNTSRDNDNIEVVKMEDLGKTARILEHRLAISSEFRTANNSSGAIATTASHSYNRAACFDSRLLPATSLPTGLVNAAHHSQHTSHDVTSSINDSNVATWNPEPWKTISGKRDKRRKKPAEQPVLSQHIPGHKGEQEVDWLVKFIESGPTSSSNMNNSSGKKIAKGMKQQPKRLSNQFTQHERENLNRKPNNKPTATQLKPLLQSKQAPSLDQTASQTQSYPPSQRRAICNDIRAGCMDIHQTVQQPTNDGANENKEATMKSKAKCTNDMQREKQYKQDDAAVTFAEHIRIIDDDASLDGKYTFGFFEDQKQHTDSRARLSKLSTRQSEDLFSCSKSKRVSQKHKLKHPKASPNSEQKRYKFNDNIDASSFNYHQILEFISNSWESTTKTHRPIVKHAGSS